MAGFERISTRQKEAIAALFTSRSIAEAARKSRVGERTLHRWLAEDSDFRAALRRTESEMLELACRRLLAMQGEALEAIEELVRDGPSDAIRLRAGLAILENALRFRGEVDIENRIAELEAIISDVKKI